jgi:hypothetical protein
MTAATRTIPLVIDPAQRERPLLPHPFPPSELSKPDGWFFGGVGDYFPDLRWDRRPDMAGTGAPEVLHDAWTAVVMAVQQAHGGRLRRGSCYYLNLAGAPLVQQVLGEPVQLCAGFGAWYERTSKIQTGFRWRPSKWADWIDREAGQHLEPLADVHCWLETATHLIDFDGGTGAPDDVWPPIIYRPKSTLLKHPREAQGAGDILMWRSAEARELVGAQIVPRALPIAEHAVELFETFTCGTLEARMEAEAKHRMVTDLGRLLASEIGDRLITSRAFEILETETITDRREPCRA